MTLGIDMGRYTTSNSKFTYIKLFFSIPGLRFMCLFRACGTFAKKHPVGWLVRVWYKNLQVKYGYQIPHTCNIGPGLFLGHFGNIVVNQSAVIGENCNISQGVTIGRVSRGKNIGSPKIGNKVWIGPNSVIVGNITIGNNVLIAPLSYVNINIPDNAVVAGNPAQIVSLNSSSGYIKNLVNE